MKFGDIIRQPLPVATFTFLVVVIVAFVRAWVTQRFAGEIPAVSAPLGYYTAAFRLSWPLLSAGAATGVGGGVGKAAATEPFLNKRRYGKRKKD